MRILKNFTMLFCIFIIPVISYGQKIIFQEGFENAEIKNLLIKDKNSENLFDAQHGTQIANLSSVIDQNSEYRIPDLNISEGMAFVTFWYKQDISSMNEKGLQVYYKSDHSSSWNLLASFTKSESIWKESTLFLPENSASYSIKFEGYGKKGDLIFLDDIRVDYYKNAAAYSEGNNIYIDSANNLSSTSFKIQVSESQVSGLPLVNYANLQTRTPGVPVLCPAGAVIEGEPDCDTNYVDIYNSGCPNPFSQLYSCNGLVCGKAGTFIQNSADNRDIDRYKLDLTGPVNVTIKVVADFPVKIFIIYIPYGCEGPSFNSVAAQANSGDTAIINNYYISQASSVVFWVAPQYFTGVACGSNYVMKYKTATIINPSTPVAVNNPSCSSTQLNPITPVANYSFYWQGTSCGISTTNPANIAYPVTSTGVYYVRGKYTPLGCWTSCSSANVIVNTLPVATFSYTGSPYLPTGTDPLPVFNGSAGMFSSTSGLVFVNTTTGEVDLSSSTPGTYTVTNTIAASGGCAEVTAMASIIISAPSSKTLTVKVFIEGLYNIGGIMHEALDFDFIVEDFPMKWGAGIADVVTVQLYDSTYGSVIATFPNVYLSINGNLSISNINGNLSDSYYITIFHRNSVPITSATPRSFTPSSVYYDFTYPIDQAYGAGLNPQKDFSDGFYGMYTGEQDHDTYYAIDGSDLSLLEPDIVSGSYGYLSTDLNGDGVVDGSDLVIIEANLNFGPLFWNPFTAK